MIPFKDRRPFGFPRLNGVARAVHLAIHHGGRLRSIDLVSSDTEGSPAVELISLLATTCRLAVGLGET